MHSQPEPTVIPGEPLDPQVYNAVISQLTPLNVRLVSLGWDVHPQAFYGQLQAVATAEVPTVRAKTELPDGAQLFEIEQRMAFDVVTTDRLVVAKGRATYVVQLRISFNPPSNFWPIFLMRNVKLYTHPPLRDLVASMCGRSNLVVSLIDSISVTQNIVPGEAPTTLAKPALG